jgi:tetratricopeptide (TPR) repeat protein
VSVYGRSFASKLIQDGKLEEAVAAAGQAIAAEADNPEHFVDRATALSSLGRDREAAPDFRRALELDQAAQILETDLIDDAYFSSLLAAARAESSADAGCQLLAGYLETLPDGRHVNDVRDWSARLRGELRTEWTKER